MATAQAPAQDPCLLGQSPQVVMRPPSSTACPANPMQGVADTMGQCLDALWSGQEHARSLRGVGLSDLESNLGPAKAHRIAGSLSRLGVGQMI